MLPISIIKRLTLARYFYDLASDNARSDAEVSSFAAINLLHDAIEIFFLACAEQLNAIVKPNTPFEQYIERINQKISPKELPLRRPLIEINKIRVNSKHHAIAPKADEVRRLILLSREFFDEASAQIFSTEFWSITLVDQLNPGESRDVLGDAEDAYRRGEWIECLMACRKAFFLEFEQAYDISEFIDPDASKKGFFGPYSDAPYHAHNKKYIDDYVNDPFDFIVLDYAKLERDLLVKGIDPTVFWNIRRLSPEIYRYKNQPDWQIKYDFDKFEADDAKERATYVLEHTIQIVLQKHIKARAERVLNRRKSAFAVNLRTDGVSVYRKADRATAPIGTTPIGVTKLMTMHSSPGLKGDGTYWWVGHIQKGLILFGYIHEDDIQGPPEPGFRLSLEAE